MEGTAMSVDITAFKNAMTKHWEETLGNHSSPELQAVWSQLAITFNSQIDGSNPRLWQVLQPPTGTGKSQGTAMYCALLATLSTTPSIEHIMKPHAVLRLHPGVLIVTRLKSDGENMAAFINKLAGCQTARAHHSENSLSKPVMINTPVLIITHSAYINALRDKSSENGTGEQLLRFHQWFHSERGLVVIDEAPDLIDTTQVSIEHLKQVLGHIPEAISRDHSTEIQYLNDLVKMMQKLSANGPQEQMLPTRNMLSVQPDFASLRKAIKGLTLDRAVLNRSDTDAKHSMLDRIRGTLDSIEKLAGQWCLFSQSKIEDTLNSARHILPENHPGAVILDATASTNLLYQLFEDRVSIVPTPNGARRYGNVTLHISKGHRVGKYYLRANAKIECAKLASEMQNIALKSKSIFVACHKDVKPYLEQHAGFQVGSYGSIDGRNPWQDFDTAVIFGLPYRDNIWAANTFMAVQGSQSTNWLGSNGNRPFGDYMDILKELRTGVIATQVIQAINRVRCRRVIDKHGNCEPTDVYMALPSGQIADDILGLIKISMPGVNVVKWAYSGSIRKPRKLKHATSLVSFLHNLIPGKTPVKEVLSELGIPKSSFEKLVPKLKDETSQLFKEMTNIGICYQVEGAGRGQKTYFMKS